MTLQTPRRRASTAIGMLVALAALAGGAWVLQRWRPFEHEPVAVTWPHNLEPLAQYVEDTTHQRFTAPVTIEFVGDEDAYADRVHVDVPEPTEEQAQRAEVDEAVGRALGLWVGDISLQKIRDAYGSAAPFPAVWRTEEKTIVVRAEDADAELPPVVRAQLVLLLTQVLDDQLYGTVERAQTAETAQDYQAAVAVSLGHAIWVHDEYIDDMDADDRDDYESDYRSMLDDFQGAVNNAPFAYRALRIAAQQMGEVFVASILEEDPALLTRAFTSDAPTALDQVSLPVGKYLHDDPLEAVDAPSGPQGADVHFTDQLGPVALFLMLAGGQPDNLALTASDGWGNDRYVTYELDGTICVDARIVTDSAADADRLEDSLDAWAFSRPDESGALVGRDGNSLLLSVCDPGRAAHQRIADEPTVIYFSGRSDAMRRNLDDTNKPALAECIAVTFYATFSFDTDDQDNDLNSLDDLDAITQNCIDTL